jgi:hypothetical protein
MPNLDLSTDDKATLIEVLETAISDLGAEIADTKSAEWRSGLKGKKRTVMAILERLQTAAE